MSLALFDDTAYAQGWAFGDATAWFAPIAQPPAPLSSPSAPLRMLSPCLVGD